MSGFIALREKTKLVDCRIFMQKLRYTTLQPKILKIQLSTTVRTKCQMHIINKILSDLVNVWLIFQWDEFKFCGFMNLKGATSFSFSFWIFLINLTHTIILLTFSIYPIVLFTCHPQRHDWCSCWTNFLQIQRSTGLINNIL